MCHLWDVICQLNVLNHPKVSLTGLSQSISECSNKYLVISFVYREGFLIEAGYVGSHRLILPLLDAHQARGKLHVQFLKGTNRVRH